VKLGIPIYQGVNLLDVSGPLEMFYWAGQSNDLETVLVSSDGGAVTSMRGVRFEAHASFDGRDPACANVHDPVGLTCALPTTTRHCTSAP
jgi:putative intracellular protease/amidase